MTMKFISSCHFRCTSKKLKYKIFNVPVYKLIFFNSLLNAADLRIVFHFSIVQTCIPVCAWVFLNSKHCKPQMEIDFLGTVQYPLIPVYSVSTIHLRLYWNKKNPRKTVQKILALFCCLELVWKWCCCVHSRVFSSCLMWTLPIFYF